ncbi:MAG TPA: DUF3352 domain-containing protein [Solirubrobacteraceae bacterium]|nr:DUF3352 domain-containing protein [Solirubrobacteraceae bacterium]
MTTSAAPTAASRPGRPQGWAAVRRRREVALVVAGLLVIGLGLGLGLGLSGAAAAPPDTGAARLVPSDALGYLNVSLDRGRPGVSQTLSAANRLPGFALARAVAEARLGALSGSGSDFAHATRAWLGDEAALAVLPAGGGGAGSRADSLVLLAARRPAAARRYLASLPSRRAVYMGGVAARELSGGAYVALLGRYVVAGQLASVRQAVDVAHGAPSLASDPAFRRASAGDPAGRALDVYAPAGGLSALLGGRGGLLGALGTLLAQPGLVSAGASLSPAPGGLRIRIHSVFSDAAGRTAGGSFDPSVLRRLPAGVAFALDTQGLPAAAPRLLSAAASVGVGGAIGPLLSRLGRALRAEGYDLAPLLALFAGQTAVAVTDTGGHPGLLVLTRTSDPAAARIVLADVAPPLASLFRNSSSGPGVAPLFNGLQTHGMVIHQLQLGAGLQVNYTVYHHLVGVSTTVSGLTSLARGAGTLGASAPYLTAFGPGGAAAGSLVFLDLRVLIRLGEQAGLLQGPGFARLAPDLDRISVIGLRARGDKSESTSELYFKIP